MFGAVQHFVWEPSGTLADAIDIQLVRNDGSRECHQLKRQNGMDVRWSIADLARAEIFRNAKDILLADPDSIYVFVSSDPPQYKDFVDRLRRDAGSRDEFWRYVQENKERKKAFDQLCGAWGLDPAPERSLDAALSLLHRMRYHVVDHGEGFDDDLRIRAALQLEGDPETSIALLGDYIGEKFGQKFFADELLRHLESKGHGPRRLEASASLPQAVENLLKRFLRNAEQRLAGKRAWDRPEVSEWLERLQSSDPPRLVFVHGRAGSGKTSIIHRLCQQLAQTHPVLPLDLQLDKPSGSPHAYGASLGLPGSPAASLSAYAGGRRAFLLLDQLDALRYTSLNAPEVWNSCKRIIEECLGTRGITIVVACRTADLTDDPLISNWRKAMTLTMTGGTADFEVGALPEEVAAAEVAQRGRSWNNLSARFKQQLRHVLALDLWTQTGDEAGDDFTTLSRLTASFLQQRRGSASRDSGLPATEISEVIKRLVEVMDKRGENLAAASSVGDHEEAVKALCSAGILQREGSRLLFAHASYLDYLIAETALRRTGSSTANLLAWLKTHQSLFTREQIRHLLFLVRDEDPRTYIDLLRSIFADAGVRFHVQHLILGFLGAVPAPRREEVDLALALARQTAWLEHVNRRVFFEHPEWFDALMERGEIARWLRNGEQEPVRWALLIVRSMEGKRPAAIDEALTPLLSDEWKWPSLTAYALAFDPATDTDVQSALRMRMLSLEEHGNYHYLLRRAAKASPLRSVEILESLLRSQIRALLSSGDSEDAHWKLGLDIVGQEMIDAVKAHPAHCWRSFGPLLSAVERLKRRAHRYNPWPGGEWSQQEELTPAQRSWLRRNSIIHSLGKGATETLSPLIAAAVASLAATEPVQSEAILGKQRPNRGELDLSIAKGLLTAPIPLADPIIAWMLRASPRLDLTTGGEVPAKNLTRTLLRRFAPACSDPIWQRLEDALLRYHDDHERANLEYRIELFRKHGMWHPEPNELGRGQNALLDALPADRMSAEARSRAALWRRKFGDPEKNIPEGPQGGMVRSPIPPSRLPFVSDRTWIEIATTRNWSHRHPSRWRKLGKDLIGQPSHDNFARDFGVVAARDPIRFAKLAMKLPRTVPSGYFAHLLWNMAEDKSGSPPVLQLAAIIEHVGDNDEDWYNKTICRVIKQRHAEPWPEAVLHRLVRMADHTDPRRPSTDNVSGAKMPSGNDLISTAINSVRGAAAGAIRMLLWADPALYEILRPAVERLLADQHPAVRLEAIGICCALAESRPDTAKQLFLQAMKSGDDSMLVGEWAGQMLNWTRRSHPADVDRIVRRMAASSDPAVREEGAMWAVAMWVQQGRLEDLALAVQQSDSTSRKGATEAAVQLHDSFPTHPFVRAILIQSMNDEAEEVRTRINQLFRADEFLGKAGSIELLELFAASRTFANSTWSFMRTIEAFTGDLLELKNVILGTAKRLSSDLASGARDISTAVGPIGEKIGELLRQLYQASYNRDDVTAEECLDQWDALVKAHVIDADRELQSLDR